MAKRNEVYRCAECGNIVEVAHLKGIDIIADGSNHDDTKDYRPGMKALRERAIQSPLQEVGLTKDEIRTLSKEYALPTWDKDALACLATRIPFGEAVTPDKLQKVDKAEEYLSDLGFRNIRARYFGDRVLIEVRVDQVPRLYDKEIFKELQIRMEEIGFSKVDIAQEGYRQGRMNPK